MTTIKQRKTAEIIKKGEATSLKEAMIKAGYSRATAKTPTKLTKAKAWQELIEEYIPDEELLRKHSEALDATKQIGAQILINKNGETISKENEGMIEVPDYVTRLKAIELAYKVKGKLKDNNFNQQINIGEEMRVEIIEDKN